MDSASFVIVDDLVVGASARLQNLFIDGDVVCSRPIKDAYSSLLAVMIWPDDRADVSANDRELTHVASPDYLYTFPLRVTKKYRNAFQWFSFAIKCLLVDPKRLVALELSLDDKGIGLFGDFAPDPHWSHITLYFHQWNGDDLDLYEAVYGYRAHYLAESDVPDSALSNYIREYTEFCSWPPYASIRTNYDDLVGAKDMTTIHISVSTDRNDVMSAAIHAANTHLIDGRTLRSISYVEFQRREIVIYSTLQTVGGSRAMQVSVLNDVLAPHARVTRASLPFRQIAPIDRLSSALWRSKAQLALRWPFVCALLRDIYMCFAHTPLAQTYVLLWIVDHLRLFSRWQHSWKIDTLETAQWSVRRVLAARETRNKLQ